MSERIVSSIVAQRNISRSDLMVTSEKVYPAVGVYNRGVHMIDVDGVQTPVNFAHTVIHIQDDEDRTVFVSYNSDYFTKKFESTEEEATEAVSPQEVTSS